MEPISPKDQEKIVVLYGSLDGQPTLDCASFTKELFKVTNKAKKNIPILDLTSLVNESWAKSKFAKDQRCKVDIVQVGDNWKDFHWPSNKNDPMEIDSMQDKRETGSEERSPRGKKRKSNEDSEEPLPKKKRI